MNKFASRIVMAAGILGFVVSSASAAISTEWVSTPMEIGGTEYVVNDLFATSDSGENVPTFEMLFDAGVDGGIYNHAGGGNQAPSAFIVSLDATAAFDSFITVGNLVDGPALVIPGAAVDIPGNGGGGAVLSNQNIDIAWASPGANPVSADNTLVARITLRTDVNSEGLLFSQLLNDGAPMSFPVVNGAAVPEPSSFALIGLALLGFIRRRR